MNQLPPIAPDVAAAVLEDLPPRLRKRLDAALPKASAWKVNPDATVEVDADTTLTFTLTGGTLTSAEQLTCSCLLAPKCLHRAIAVSVAPIASAQEPPSAEVVPAEVSAEPAPDVSQAAEGLWQAGSAVLRAGISGSGAVVQASLLRAVHTARLAGLHRASAAALRVVAGVRAAHARDPAFDRVTATADLSELLVVCHQLRAGTGSRRELLGTARREYKPIGSLRLFGLFTERVVATNGYSGVVTHLVDAEGRLWTVPAITPGGPDQVSGAFEGPVAVGESGLSHRQLSRSGLLLSSATASADHRLGAGSGVRAVAAAGAAWTEPPLDALWQEPLEAQLDRAFTTGNDLLFLESGHDVTLVGESDIARDNLRLMGGAPDLRFVARLDPARPATAIALAAAGALKATGGHVNLTLERLQRSNVDTPSPGRAPRPARQSPNDLLERWLHRTTLGGRRIPALASAANDQAHLNRLGLAGSARLLADLQSKARDETRDPFGRLISEATDDFTLAWLRASLYTTEFARSAARSAWLDR